MAELLEKGWLILHFIIFLFHFSSQNCPPISDRGIKNQIPANLYLNVSRLRNQFYEERIHEISSAEGRCPYETKKVNGEREELGSEVMYSVSRI